MTPEFQAALDQFCKEHGEGCAALFLRDAVQRRLQDINFSCATEERIAERSEPWERTCAELNKLCPE